MLDATVLQAKSDQMNAVDFVKPMVFRITKVDYFPKQLEQPIYIHLEGHDGRPYKPCKSMLRGLAQAWGMNEKDWEGRLMELYCDPSVKWGGKDVGGIRISGVSGITSPQEFVVTLNRSQRQIHTFRVLVDGTKVKKEFILTHYEDDVEKAKTDEDISKVVALVKAEFGDDELNQLKPCVVKARELLKTGAPK